MKRIVLILATCIAAIAPAIAASPKSAGTSAGVYTQAQASEGSRVYAVRCAMCHGGTLSGTVETPGLTGKFMANWAGRPVADLYDYLARAMPQPAPGSLSPQDNARLVAFLLEANGAPAGKAPLPADSAALRRIILQPVRPR
ncbi:MAG TPA: cytochrome c [Sphingomonadaceae bacterium]|nr:cytochrome c [Sphingomonadaceae bacterium]